MMRMESKLKTDQRNHQIPATCNPKNFALLGIAGYVAEKHLKAMQETGNELVAAVDPHDSVGGMDQFFPKAAFFQEVEQFDRFLEMRRRSSDARPVDYVSICTPNYLHDAHIRLALRAGATAICEKPLVIDPAELDNLEHWEAEFQSRIYTVLQLRYHSSLFRLKQIMEQSKAEKKEVCLTYVTRRGNWYHQSWKGDMQKSGGLALNIGIHLFDLLLWIFGPSERSTVQISTPSRMAGTLELEQANVKWFLSVDEEDLPSQIRQQGGYSHRCLVVNGERIDLTVGFENLHTKVYQEIIEGRGFGIADARPSLELVHEIMRTDVTPDRLVLLNKMRIAG